MSSASAVIIYQNSKKRKRKIKQKGVAFRAAQSKKATSRKKPVNNIEVEPEFDGSEYISTAKTIGKRIKASENDKSKP